MSEQIHCTFDGYLYSEIKEASQVMGISGQQLIKDAVISFLNRTHDSTESASYKFTFIDLFAGIGGFRSGLMRVGGFECIGHCEINKYTMNRKTR